jgi:hypothetical protein
MRLPDQTRGFLVSFAEPGAIAPVLIPLDTYGGGFCRELLIGYLGLRSYMAVENITDGLSGITNRTDAPASVGAFLYLRMSRIAWTNDLQLRN